MTDRIILGVGTCHFCGAHSQTLCVGAEAAICDLCVGQCIDLCADRPVCDRLVADLADLARGDAA